MKVFAVAGYHTVVCDAFIFQVREKSGNCVDGQGNFERNLK